MNAYLRKRTEELKDYIKSFQDKFDKIYEDLEDLLDNYETELLRVRRETSLEVEEADFQCDCVNDACDSIENVIKELEDAVTALGEALE